MLKSDAAAFLAGVKQVEGAAASAPTNLHVITGEVGTTSEDGKTTISLDGLVFSEEDSQEIEMDTLGGLEEGDVATVLLTGENGRGMTPLAIGAPGSIDRIKTIASSAAETAEAAQEVAEATNQHFFADDNGIHVTEATQEDWDTNHTGANVLINSIGQLFRDGLNNLLTLTTQDGARSLAIWDGIGNNAENVLAQFTTDQASLAGGMFEMSYKDTYSSVDGTVTDSTAEISIGEHRDQFSSISLNATPSNNRSFMTFQASGNGYAAFVLDSGSTDYPERRLDLIYLDRINYADPYGGSDRQLGVPTRLTASGSYKAGTSDTMGPHVTLTAGIWIINGIWSFANSSSNSKRLAVGLYRSSTGNVYTYRVHTTASSSSVHRLEVSDTIVVSASSETVTLYGASSPASTAAAPQYITAIRLA